jgi:hypothetical protein
MSKKMQYKDLEGNNKELSLVVNTVRGKSSLNPKIKWEEIVLIVKNHRGKIVSRQVLDYKEVK